MLKLEIRQDCQVILFIAGVALKLGLDSNISCIIGV